MDPAPQTRLNLSQSFSEKTDLRIGLFLLSRRAQFHGEVNTG
jgi:hypothetical protein